MAKRSEDLARPGFQRRFLNQAQQHTKTFSILTHMKIIILTSIFLLSTTSFSEIPLGVEIFKRPGLGTPMEIKTSRYGFSIENKDGTHFIKGTHPNGSNILHTIRDGGVKNIQRIFLVESHFCGEKFVDLVLQMNPSRYEETQQRSYYRIVFSSDLSSVISEFYDPSVAAVNAIVPMQSAEGVPSPDLDGELVCDGSTPKAVYP